MAVSIPQAVSTIAIVGNYATIIAKSSGVSIPQAVSTIAIRRYIKRQSFILKFQYRKR